MAAEKANAEKRAAALAEREALAAAKRERKAALANADRVRAMVAKASAGGNVALSPALAAKVRAAVSRRDAAVAAYNAAIMAM